MIATEERDAVRPLQFKTEKQLECLDRVVAAVDEITHEDVASVRDLATLFKELKQVMELPMNITANGDRRAHGLHIAFLDQDLLNLLAEDAQVSLWQDPSILD